MPTCTSEGLCGQELYTSVYRANPNGCTCPGFILFFATLVIASTCFSLITMGCMVVECVLCSLIVIDIMTDLFTRTTVVTE